MIRAIEIQGFRGIREGKLEDLTPLVVLVGPNGCGKSTILDALLLGASPIPGKAINFLDEERARIKREARWLIWKAEPQTTAQIELTADQSDGKHVIQMQSLASENLQNSIQFDLLESSANGITKISLGSISDNGFSGNSGQSYPLSGITEVHLVEFNRSKSQVPLVDIFSEALEQGRREEARSILMEVLPGATSVEIGTYKKEPRLVVVYPDRGVPLELAGDGIQSLARLCLELAVRPDGVVLLEEPEAHQHPRAISRSARAIFAAIRRGVQVILSTHNLELIDYLLTEVSDDDELEKLSVHRLLLRDGCLTSHRISGPDVAFRRVEIEDDLR
jgi:energy-coupling factor transporter ATP-binding protein EcfA2